MEVTAPNAIQNLSKFFHGFDYVHQIHHILMHAHAFWTDTISLLETSQFNADAFTHHAQITDSYLLALAVKNKGRLVTLDPGIKTETVQSAKQVHLQVI